ncbi:MAG: hypothetical protein AAF725_27305, partial [Acidobacteriota bacterium]
MNKRLSLALALTVALLTFAGMVWASSATDSEDRAIAPSLLLPTEAEAPAANCEPAGLERAAVPGSLDFDAIIAPFLETETQQASGCLAALCLDDEDCRFTCPSA